MCTPAATPSLTNCWDSSAEGLTNLGCQSASLPFAACQPADEARGRISTGEDDPAASKDRSNRGQTLATRMHSRPALKTGTAPCAWNLFTETEGRIATTGAGAASFSHREPTQNSRI